MGCFLAFGPLLSHLQYFCSRTVSWTTDFGVEILSVQLSNMLEAFFHFVGGATLEVCRPLVGFSQRCFPRSLRIAGWSHGFGNVMKQVAKSWGEWPKRL